MFGHNIIQKYVDLLNLKFATSLHNLPILPIFFSLNRPLDQFSLYVTKSVCCPSWKPCFPVDWTPLVKECIDNIR